MLAVTRGALTSEIQIEIQWLALTATAEIGDSEITSY
jgi:hypothetical protein